MRFLDIILSYMCKLFSVISGLCMSDSKMKCGIIMGYYGDIWSFKVIQQYAKFCAEEGFYSFLYGPKKDVYLRDQWMENWPDDTFSDLSTTRNIYKNAEVSFGVALSPVNVVSFEDDKIKENIKKRLEQINLLNVDTLVISFDDIDISVVGSCGRELAKVHIEVAEYIRKISNAKSFCFVPSYYSNSSLLLHALGNNADNREDYLAEISNLNQCFKIFWSGSDVISRGIAVSEIEKINQVLKRKVTLWDNYPCNDPVWMRQSICNVFPFSGRSHKLAEVIDGHFANPMIQPFSSQIALASLPQIYEQKAEYNAQESFIKNLNKFCPKLTDFFINQSISLIEISYAPDYTKAIERIKADLESRDAKGGIFDETKEWLLSLKTDTQ